MCASDGAYSWLNNLPIAEAPQWLIDLVRDDAPALDSSSSSGEKNFFEQYGDELREPVPLNKIAIDAEGDPEDDDVLDWDDWNDVGMATMVWRAQ